MNTELKFRQSGVHGAVPDLFASTHTLDGSKRPWVFAPIGMIWFQIDRAIGRVVKVWQRRGRSGRTSDWGPLGGTHVLHERVARSQFTDDATTVGKYQMRETIPAGAVVLRTLIKDVVGFIGDTSATIQVGEGTGDDVDRFTTGTPSVFTTAANIDAGAVSGAAYVGTAMRPWIHITGNSDFTDITDGEVTVEIVYIQ